MQTNFAPVPVHEHELLQELCLGGGMRVTQSWHRASTTIARHAHREATLTILLDGSFHEHYVSRRELICEAPSAHVRPPGAVHLDQLGNLGAHLLVIELEQPRLEALHRFSSLFADIRKLESVAVLEMIRRIRRELAINDQATGLALEGLAMEMIAAAGRSLIRNVRAPPRWIAQIHDLLRDRFRESLRLDELAQVAQVHPVHLARAFRAAYGTSPGEFIRRLRIEWAARQVAETGRPLAEIALDAGYSDQSHFSRVFKAFYKIPPGTWRRRFGDR